MNKVLLTTLCSVMVACLGLTACDPLEPTTPQAPEQDEGVTGSSPSQQLSAKPTAPIDVSYHLIDTGKAIELELVITSSHVDAPVYISLTDLEGEALAFSPASAERQLVNLHQLKNGRAGEHRFRLEPDGFSEQWVNVHLEVETEMGSLSRNMAIPLPRSQDSHTQRGMEKAAHTAARAVPDTVVTSDERGEAIIPLPVDEISLR